MNIARPLIGRGSAERTFMNASAGARSGYALQSADASPPPLDDPAVVKAGARGFAQLGCVNCHGAPGAKWAKFSEGLRPDPPDLKDIANQLEPRQLFWVIKNGIKMTGMPSFGLIKTEDQEIWAIVAFIKKLPTVSPEDYKAWSEPAASAAPSNR